MTLIELTQEQLAGSRLIEPGWYGLEVSKCTDKESKDGSSMNTWMTFKVVDEGGFQGEMVPVCINHPYAQIVLKKLMPAVGLECKPGQIDLSEEAWKGLKVQGFIKNGTVPGNSEVRNILEDFRPFDIPRG